MNNYNNILKIINKVVKQVRLNKFIKYFSISLLFTFISILLLGFLEYLFRFDHEIRFIILSTISFLFISFIGFNLVSFLRYKLSITSNIEIKNAAELIGAKFDDIKDQLFNAIQLFEEKNTKFSSDLIDASLESVYKNISSKDLSNVIESKDAKKILSRSLGTAFIIIISFFTLSPLSNAINRIYNYDISYEEPLKFSFNIEPGNSRITKGDDIEINVKVIGIAPKSIGLFYKDEDDAQFNKINLSLDSNQTSSYKLNELTRSVVYYVQADDIQSDQFKIEVLNRPLINSLAIEVIPPSYSKLPIEILNDNGNIQALKGSLAKFNIGSNKELKKAEIVFSDSTTLPFELINKSASSELRLLTEQDYSIRLIDEENISNENPIQYSIKIIDDEFPFIELTNPTEDIKLGATDLIPISVKVSDDFGFSKLTLNYRLSASRYKEVTGQINSKIIDIDKNINEQIINHIWDISPEQLAEDDVVTFYLEIFDNDNISGPKSAKSVSINIRVPSLDELFAQADNVNKSAQEDFKEIFEEAKKLSDELKNIENELKKDSKEITYEEKDKIEKSIEKFNELADKVEDIQQEMQKMQKDLAENNLLSEETLKKYMELQELLDELSSPEMRESLERMQEMLKNLNRDQVQNSFEDMQLNEEMFQKSIERTLNLLKRVQAEQKMDELVKRAENLTEQLNELKEQTEQSDLKNQSENKNLQQKQDDVTSSLDKFEKEMEALKEMLEEIPEMSSEELDEIKEEFEKQNNDEKSNEAKEQIAKKMKQNAMQQQQQLSQNMQSMQQQMEQMMESMMMQSQMETFGEMYQALDNLLSLSKSQENLKEKSKSLSPNSPQFNKQAQEQNQLTQNLDRVLAQLGELSQKTFAITPEMGRALGNARSEMSQAVNQMQGRNGSLAFQKQSGAMQSLNEAANLLQSMMNQMMNQSGGGSGMMSMMQQLQQMSQQQMNLNQMTQMLKSGQMTQQQMAQMQRLAQQQQMIQKSLEQLNKETKETGESKKLAGNLEDIINEMKEVVKNMSTQKVDDNLVESQNRILSKLLDAQRSINERDFEKNRESNEGKDLAKDSPGELLLNEKEILDRLRDQLLNAAKEGYSKDYQELIKKYFEALEKKSN